MSSEMRPYRLKARALTQQETRQRIVEATMGLHEEVGPARTTVAEIARRAGVQRLTVYNHFPEDAELVAACQGHWLDLNPPPDFGAALSLPSPEDAVRQALRVLYGWYAGTARMAENVQRDRARVPALDALLRASADVQLSGLAAALAARVHPSTPGPDADDAADVSAAAALAGVAVSFWTWRTLHARGLSGEQAVDVMASALFATLS